MIIDSSSGMPNEIDKSASKEQLKTKEEVRDKKDVALENDDFAPKNGNSKKKTGFVAILLGVIGKIVPLNTDHPAARQKTPFNFNRYVLLLLYVLYAFLTASCYFGWTPLSGMIFRNNGFSSLCKRDPNNPDNFVGDMRKEGKLHICDEQDAAVQKMYTITVATHTAMSAVAGLLLDHIGPLYTALFGQILTLSAWITLSFCGSFGGLYYLAFILMGLGADTGFLPTLTLLRLFPGSTGLIITSMGSAASISFAIPSILNQIWISNLETMTFRKTCLSYAGFGPGLCFLIALLFIPKNGFIPCEEFDIEKEKKDLIEQEKKNKATNKSIACDNNEDSKTEIRDDNNPKFEDSEKVEDNCENFIRHTFPFRKQLCSQRYILVVSYFIVVNITSAYYQQANRRMFNNSVVSFMEILLPLSFIPCIILGKCADIVGILPIMCLINSSGLMTYVFALISNEVCWYFSVVFFSIYMSLFTSQVFCYIEFTFSPRHFGKLIGLCSMTGGLLSLLSNLLYDDVTIKLNKGKTNPMKIAFVIVYLFTYMMVFRLIFLLKKNPKPYKVSIDHLDDVVSGGKV